MKFHKLCTLFLLWSAVLGRGAVGDVLWCAVETNGWVAQVCVEGICGPADGMFRNFFIATTNKTATATNVIYTLSSTNGLKIDMVSPGYQPDGSSNVIDFTVYGEEVLRLPYPGHGTNDIFSDATGTNGVFRVVLTDFVGYKDENLLAAVHVGAFATTNAVTNCNSIAGLSVTNGSTLRYPKAIANWTWPGWQQETGSVMTVRAVGFNHYARNGQPLACMEFITTGDVITTNRVSQMEIDWSTSDVIHFGEYICRIPLAPFAHSNLLRIDRVDKPWRGDSGAVFDTRDNLFSQPTPFPAAITNFYFTNTYSAIAVVDLAGSDSNGRSTNTTYDLVNPAHYYSTINAALAGIRTNNNALFGHQDCGGAMVYVRTGITNSMGGTASMAGTPRVWATVIEYPGDTVVFTNFSGTTDISDRVKYEDVELAYGTGLTPWNGVDVLWFKNCVFRSAATAPINVVKSIYVTGGSAPQWTEGFKPFGANESAFTLLRGIDLDGMNAAIHWWTMVGCRKTTHSGATFAMTVDNTSWPGPAPDFQILYNNSIKGLSNTVAVSMGGSHGTTNGMAVVQNEFEGLRASSSMATYTSEKTNVSTNVVWLHNGIEGLRQQYFYNAGPVSKVIHRVYCQAKNSIFTNPGEASDTDASTGPDGVRIGDWPVRWRVGSSGNVVQMLTYEATHSTNENTGLNNFHSPNHNFVRTDAAWIQYVNRAGFGSGGTGPGNYRLRSSSPIFSPLLHADWVLPFDIEGVPRARIDPPGAYASGYVGKGAFF